MLMSRPQNLAEIKEYLSNLLSREERLELINYFNNYGTFDIIGNLPVNITTLILEYFIPSELCALRLVSKTWNEKVTHDAVWKPICQDYSIISADYDYSNWYSNVPIFHDIFQRSLTMTKTWKTLECKRFEIRYNRGPILCMLFVHLTRLFTGDIDGKIHVWDAQNYTYLQPIQAHKSHVACLAHQNEFLASGSQDKTISIHRIDDFTHVTDLNGHEGPVTSLVFSTFEDDVLFSGSVDKTIRVWNINDKSCLRVIHGQENTISSLIYSPHFPMHFCQSQMEIEIVKMNKAGYIISGSSDHNIYLWDLKTSAKQDIPEVINAIMETNGPITAIAMYDEFIEDETRNNTINEYVCARQPINIPTFIVYAGKADHSISIYSLPGFEKTYVKSPNVHQGTIWSISTACIHSKLVTTSADRTAIVWDLKSPKHSITLTNFDSAVVSSAIAPQEEILCLGTEKGTIVIYDLQKFK